MALSSPGIGSNLDINGIVSQLMAVESQPLTALARKEASYQAKLSAFGSLNSALSTFQNAVSALSNPSKFQSTTLSSSDQAVLRGTSTSDAAAGSYNVTVTQLAQSQTVMSAGQASTTATIGAGASTTLTFEFGTIGGGTFVSTGSKLPASIASGGIAANSLTINGTTIVTSASTNSAKNLATQINLLTSDTGVTATAQATDTGALGNFTTTTSAATYTLDVGGVNIISNAAIGTTATDIDARLIDPTVAANLTAAGIAFSGTAAAGTLKFTKADGTNIAIQESGAGAAGGFTTTIGAGTTKTFTAAVSLSSSAAITVGGTNPTAAGFTTGIQPNTYTGASFTQDSDQTTGTVTIDNTNNTLQGIRDAINKANLGITATIVSDGSSTPYRLVIASNKTGATSSLKIGVSGDAALDNLLGYDPAGAQNMTQTATAQSAALSVNGVAVTSKTNSVNEAIQGVTLNLSKTGSSTITVARDTSSVSAGVNSFVKAYNDLNKTLKDLTAYNAETKEGGPLLGDATVRTIQNGIRQTLNTAIAQLSGTVTKLSDIGVTVQKDGSLALDSAKLQTAITNNFSGIGALFATMGSTTDSLVSFSSSTLASKPGKYDVSVTTLATQGKIAGSAAAGLTITAGVNDQLTLTVNGTSATVTLVAGTYSVDSLVSHVQSVVNSASAFSSAGVAVKVSADGSGIMTIESNKYGSTSTVSVGGTGASNLLGAAPLSTAGVDVAGTIGGYTATGSGQTLTGAAGSVVEGLKLQINGGSTGARGTVSFTQGYAFQLNKVVEGYLGSSGLVSGRTDGINSSIKDIGRQRDALNARLQSTEKRLRAQFTALDTLIANMNKTSSYLQQQLSNLPKIE
ncbi:flagellar filament capping protein FliD [Herbaspirillum sp. ST 5-3]|uniref:flagellar filament capping protein FliD n=1 Tax=Oxalobacteraceae TaxID=75682 RepID=UPI0010A42184|nr:flagellar filament capping protein FliD [Herbaspirillum sp. ST 5-3]